jgi:hypothetical protein
MLGPTKSIIETDGNFFNRTLNDAIMVDNRQKLNQMDLDYQEEAKQWIMEAVIIITIGLIVEGFLISGGSSGGIVLALLVNIGLIVVVSIRLFRHIDTLILKRLSQYEAGSLSPSDEWTESKSIDKEEPNPDNQNTENVDTVVGNRHQSNLWERAKQNLYSRLFIGFIIPIIIAFVILAAISGNPNETTTAPLSVSVLLILGPIVGMIYAYSTYSQQ